MVITSRLTEKKFFNASITVLYSRKVVIFITGLAIFLLIMFLLSAITSDTSYIPLVIPLIMLLYFPLTIFLATRNNFKNNARNTETIEYIIDSEFLLIKGESFHTRLSWIKLYKVVKKWGWLLIWHNSQTANAIKIDSLSNQEFFEFKNILNKNGVKNNL